MKTAVVAAVLLAVVMVYLPGLRGPFVLDDGENITLNRAVAIKTFDFQSLKDAASSNESGVFKRPIPAVSFALNHYFAGGFDSTFGFKATNLVIHLINTVLVWWLCLALLNTPAGRTAIRGEHGFLTATVVTASWALHPIQLTNVLYVVQRMNSLAALWIIAGLIVYLHGRMQLQERPARAIAFMSLGAITGMMLGLLSKENAILWPLFAFVIELTLMHLPPVRGSHRLLIIFYSAMSIAVVCAGAIALLSHPTFVHEGYTGRPFTPLERLMTEARVLWFYVFSIFIPDPRHFSLFHDDLAVSTGVVTPWTTLPAIAGVVTTATLAAIYRHRFPIASFALLWFLVGHSLESSVLGLEIAYEHRNYLPSVGLLFGAIILLIRLGERSTNLRLTVTAFLIASIILLGAVTLNWSTNWRDALTLANELVRQRPNSPRANAFAARVNLTENRDIVSALRYTLRGMEIAPRESGFRIDLQILLAILAHEIERRPDRLDPRLSKSGDFLQVPGLDAFFEIRWEQKQLRLVHQSSVRSLPTLLAAEPITAHTVFSIERLHECVVAPDHLCARLHSDALAWLSVAVDNPNASRSYRAIIAADTAILHAYRGDYRLAHEYMTRASELLPTLSSYEISRTEYLIRLCDFDGAQRLMTEMEVRAIDTGRLRKIAASVHAKDCRPQRSRRKD